MDTHQDLPSASTGQPSQPQAQEQLSPSGQPRIQEQYLPLGESVESGARPPSQSTIEKPLLAGSEGHSPAHGRNDPNSGSEPTPQTLATVRNSDGHMVHGPSRRTTVMGRANSGLDWIVPVEEKPKVCATSHFFLALDPQHDLQVPATHHWRAPRPYYYQCREGKGPIRHKRLVKVNLFCLISDHIIIVCLVSDNILIMFLSKQSGPAMR
jgi:hypothetical protein